MEGFKGEEGNRHFEVVAWPECVFSTGSELQVRTPNCTALDAASENPKELTVSLGPDEVSFSEFVRQGWRRENVRPGACGVAAAGEEGWTSKSAPALRFRPSQYFDSRLVYQVSHPLLGRVSR